MYHILQYLVVFVLGRGHILFADEIAHMILTTKVSKVTRK